VEEASSSEGMGAERRDCILHIPRLVVRAAQHVTLALKIPAWARHV